MSFACVLAFVAFFNPHGEEDGFSLKANARAYFETAYLSSGGTLTYTEPVAEQYAIVTAQLGSFGRIMTDMWLCSALNGQTDDVHRRAFYIYEGTLTYGYGFDLADGVRLVTDGGLLWNWLGGYKTDHGTPLTWIAIQSLENPYVTPYWNLKYAFRPTEKTCLRFGARHAFHPFESLDLTPFIEAAWGDGHRFESNFGAEPEHPIAGGAFMFSSFGLLAEWRFLDDWYVWGRFRQYILINSQAWHLMDESDSPTAETDLPIFGLGVGCRF